MAVDVLVPPLGQTVNIVTLVEWYAGEGEPVTKGEMLFAIETDKATLDIEAPASGVLRQVTAQAGDEVEVLGAIALIAAPDENLETGMPISRLEPRSVPSASLALRDKDADPGTSRRTGERIFVSPRARLLAAEQGVSLEDLQATGPEGAIVERDVRTYLDATRASAWASPESSALAQAAPAGERETAGAIPLAAGDRVRQRPESTAHVTLNTEADATALVVMRRHLLQSDVNAAYNDLLLFILARGLREHPRLTATIQGDAIHLSKRIDIGVAVDTDQGLLLPVVRDVDGKGIRQIATETQALAERARAGQCRAEELAGATFALANLGTYGIDSFSPAIESPGCAVLGVGRIKRRTETEGSRVVVRRQVWVSLAFDRRLVDAGHAARFLQRVLQMVEHPQLLLA